jgi:MHS family proline/betaine transporter-like MFS transporter
MGASTDSPVLDNETPYAELSDAEKAKHSRRPVIAAAAGTFIEFFDYASYSYLATTIARVFFPTGDVLATLETFALFAVSFAMRPIGAMFWGHFGDRLGRKKTLAITIIGIGLATTLIGTLPGFQTVGYWAPVLLVLLRLCQSFCTAGEYSGAAVMVSEYAPANKRARFISAVPISCAAGFLVASTLATVLLGQLTDEQMASWGWRILFLAAAPMTLVGIWLRSHVEETPVFKEAQTTGTIDVAPMTNVFRRHWGPLIKMICVMGVNAAGYYLVLGYMATYLEVQVGLSSFHASTIMTIGLIVYMPMLFLGAMFADRFGRKRMLLICSLGFVFLSYPIFLWMGHAGFTLALILQLFLVFMFSLNDSTFPTYFTEVFPPTLRLSGFALPFNIGNALFGGTAPFVADGLIAWTKNPIMPAFVVIFVGIIGTIALLSSPETAPRVLKKREEKALQAKAE